MYGGCEAAAQSRHNSGRFEETIRHGLKLKLPMPRSDGECEDGRQLRRLHNSTPQVTHSVAMYRGLQISANEESAAWAASPRAREGRIWISSFAKIEVGCHTRGKHVALS